MIKYILFVIAFLASATASAECSVQALGGTGNTSFVIYEDFVDQTNGTNESADDNAVAPVDLIASNLKVTVVTAPGSGASWIFALRDDGSSTTLTCTIANAETSCEDVTHTPTVAQGSRLNFMNDPTAGSVPTASGTIRITFCWSEAP
ncbi:unnamed protein product [marine sediment metagenome]|uniref:Uncharacterized protein n=1 Tax=marine sediment metagenome TaxID=412755 RepID=X0XJK8_9ZZZZ